MKKGMKNGNTRSIGIDKIDWDYISANQKLNEDFIREFQDKVDWKAISEYQSVTYGHATSEKGKQEAMQQEETIVLPNIFTPNGDGKNDEFSIDLSSYEFLDYSLVILDMNNQLVFKSNNPLESWNGKKVDGDVCPIGSYVYYLTGKTVSGKTVSKYSTLRIQY
jgi:gliding motility-associated-like protein